MNHNPPTAPGARPSPVGPPARRSNTRWWVIGGLLAVVVLVVVLVRLDGGGVPYLQPLPPDTAPLNTGQSLPPDAGDQRNIKPDSTLDTRVLWSLPAISPVAGDEANQANGVWLTDTAVVRGRPTSLDAYDLATGRPRWSLARTGEQVCRMSPTTENGTGAIVDGGMTKAGPRCNHLVAVNTTTGRPLWTADLGTATIFTASVSVAGGVVVVQTSGAVHGYSAANGKPLWRQGDLDPAHHCPPSYAVASGDRALVVTLCDGEKTGAIAAIDVHTGRVAWTHELKPSEGALGMPVSVRPAVIAVSPGGNHAMLVLDDGTGKARRLIPDSVGGFELRFTVLSGIVPTGMRRDSGGHPLGRRPVPAHAHRGKCDHGAPVSRRASRHRVHWS